MDIFKLVIVDDHIIFRKGLHTILNEIGIIKVMAEASNADELFEILKKQEIDVILMDINMPGIDGIEATKIVLSKYPDTKVIALTMHEEIGYFNKMMDAGAAGFLLKKTTKDELEEAIQTVMNGENYFSAEFISSANLHKKSNATTNVKLSERELEILEMICKGYSNPKISQELGLSQRTIDGHRARLFEKTGAKNAPHLVMFAFKHGIVKV